jgi:hypothetical protein
MVPQAPVQADGLMEGPLSDLVRGQGKAWIAPKHTQTLGIFSLLSMWVQCVLDVHFLCNFELALLAHL